MTLSPKIKLKMLPVFPSAIYGGTGIEVTKQNGTLTVDLDYADFGSISSIPTSPTSYILTYDTVTNAYVMVPSHLLGGGVSGIADAPVDGTQYGRQSGAWTNIVGANPATVAPLMNGSAAVGASLLYARQDHVHPTDSTLASLAYVNAQNALKAPLASPVFTGDPQAPTPAISDNDTSIATTAYVKAVVAAASGGTGTVANPTATIGLTPVNGVALSAIRSDGAPALSQAIAPTWTGPHSWSFPSVTGSSTTSLLSFYMPGDAVSAGTNFFLPFAVNVTRNGGSGHREAMDVRQFCSVAAATEFVVGAQFAGHLTGGLGLCFGLNSWSEALAGVGQAAQVISFEANTNVLASVNAKVGIQVIDVAGSNHSGSVFDAGMIIACQPGGVGYSTGIRFGYNNNNSELGIYPGGSLISACNNTVAVGAGITFEGMTNFSVSPIVLPPNNRGIFWGSSKQGGAIVSETTSGAGDISFVSGNTLIRFTGAASGDNRVAIFTPTDTYLTFRSGSSFYLRRVIVDGPDTAGIGYRNVKVEN